MNLKTKVMKYLSPEIAKMSKKVPNKNLVNKGTSCGIFQDVGKDPLLLLYQKNHSKSM